MCRCSTRSDPGFIASRPTEEGILGKREELGFVTELGRKGLGVQKQRDTFAVAGDGVREGRHERGLAGAGLTTHQDRCGCTGLISAFIFSFTLCWNEFIYALTLTTSVQNKTVPVAIVSELVDGDVYRWGSLMAGALVGSLPLVVLYAFFVEHYVSAMTGAVKE